MATERQDRLEQLEAKLAEQGEDSITKFYRENGGSFDQVQHVEDLYQKTLRMEVILKAEGAENHVDKTAQLLEDHLAKDVEGEHVHAAKIAVEKYLAAVEKAHEEVAPQGRNR